LKELRTKGFDVTGIFYNPNIHPYREYQKRGATLLEYAQKAYLNVVWSESYPMEEFLKQTAFKGNDRCIYCLSERLRYTAEIAVKEKYDAFTSTLLYSKYQKHDIIQELGHEFSRKTGISFYYQDFRVGWWEGVNISKEMQLYRQPYCGCIYSEKERYYKQQL
jgi:hypothetical protein